MPTKLTAEHAERLTALGDGWEDSEAEVSINAKDAAALGFPLDADLKTGRPLAIATVQGNELFLRTRDLQVAE